MSAPVLPLQAENLNSLESVGILRAWMSFPDDERRRKKIIAYYESRAVHMRLTESPPDKRINIEAGLIARAFATAMWAPDEETLTAWAEERECDLLGLGAHIWLAIPLVMRREKGAIGRAFDIVDSAMSIDGTIPEKSDLTNKKTRFWSVLALWAAYMEWRDRDHGAPVPCRPEDVANFLSISELFRDWCENNKAPYSSDPLIPAGVSLRLPEDVLAILPKAKISIQEPIGTD